MKRTGPSKEKTKQLIALLEKTTRKEKKALWLDIAERLGKPRRQRASINLWKLNKLARIFKGKTLLVPGKVLAKGDFEEKADIAAFEFSDQAKTKIEKAGGKALSIEELLEKKTKANGVIIIK